MGHAGYYRAAIPEPFNILGKRLLPLSLGHITTLSRLDSPFFSETKQPVAVGDLALAVAVCSLDYEAGVRLVQSPETPTRMRKWGRRLCNHPVFWWKDRGIDWKSKIDLFVEYLRIGSEAPGWIIGGEMSKASSEVNAPSHQVVKVVLLSKTNLSESEIMNRPWSLCLWDFITLRAIDGQVNIVEQGHMQKAFEEANMIQERINANNARA